VAKKKKNISAETSYGKERKEKDSMVSKVEVKTAKVADQDKISRTLGTVFIILGIALVGYGIFSFVKYNREPELDENLEVPFVSESNNIVNTDEITIEGIASGYNDVFLYVNGEYIGKTDVDKDGNFSYKYPVLGEGKYEVAVAGVKGFPKRYMSNKSESKVIEVDKTSPVLQKITYPSEVGTSTFSLAGVSEAGCEVAVKRGTSVYRSECDDSGNFTVKGIALDEGPNVFTMEIKDKAGNVTNVEEKIKVAYSLDSDVNGEAVGDLNGAGVTDSTLPVASGNLGEALGYILQNELMSIFGLLAIASFMLSSGIVLVKKNYGKVG